MELEIVLKNTDDTFDRHSDFIMGKFILNDIVEDFDSFAKERTDDADTIRHFVSKFRKYGKMPIDDVIIADEKGILWDGYHRIIAAKISGLEKVAVIFSKNELHTDTEIIQDVIARYGGKRPV